MDVNLVESNQCNRFSLLQQSKKCVCKSFLNIHFVKTVTVKYETYSAKMKLVKNNGHNEM